MKCPECVDTGEIDCDACGGDTFDASGNAVECPECS